MCVPDLSTCESCSDFSSSGIFWTANCCGVFVEGMYLINIGFPSSKSVPVKSLSSPSFVDGPPNYMYDVCFMVYPFVSEYATIASCGSVVMGQDVNHCASFLPKCALTYCSESPGCRNPYL